MCEWRLRTTDEEEEEKNSLDIFFSEGDWFRPKKESKSIKPSSLFSHLQSVLISIQPTEEQSP